MLFTPSRKKIKYFSSLNPFYIRATVVIIDNIHLAADEASTPDESSNWSKFRVRYPQNTLLYNFVQHENIVAAIHIRAVFYQEYGYVVTDATTIHITRRSARHSR